MKEKTLFRISFFVSALGIILLFIISDALELEETRLNETDKLLQDSAIKITGRVAKVDANENITRIRVEQLNAIDAIVFDELNISAGMNVEITGKVDEFKGKRQIVVEELKIRD